MREEPVSHEREQLGRERKARKQVRGLVQAAYWLGDGL
jgi:hypothetical protein